MYPAINFENSNWWAYADEGIRGLMKQSFELLAQVRENDGFNDYSYIVFPAAKAYEGFLKKLFWEMRLIGRYQYYGEHFRIGRALSPSLPKRYRAGWVYGKLVNYCKGDKLPLEMWEVWKRARNRIFHFFPNSPGGQNQSQPGAGYQGMITLAEAKILVGEIAEIMEKALAGCRV